MATKIRLQRFGKKGKPVYHIVAADSRSKRDGRYIEKLGIYNPNTSPATIDLNHDRALYWVQVGAVPTDTTRAVLSYTGVMMKKHLLDGVKKGAHTEEQALAKYEAWLEGKVKMIGEASSAIAKTKADAAAKALAAEKETRAIREAAIIAKNTPEVEETEEVVAEEATAVATTEEAPVEEAATEETEEEEEVVAEEATAVATTEEAPVEEAATEETAE
jgi:small subunit ribosomal protein S16